MNKLLKWQARFEKQLSLTLEMVKEFHSKDRLSEASSYLAQLNELQAKVQYFIAEVSLFNVIYH